MASTKLPSVLSLTEDDVQLLIAAGCHIGSKNVDKKMESYVYNRRPDGMHIINIGKTWEKLVLAARIIAAIENPHDVCVVSASQHGQRAVLKFAAHVGAQAIAGRFTPGSFTNYITRSFKEPRLVVVTDPRLDAQAIQEAAYVNIPVIALCSTESKLQYVDVAIPTNIGAKNAIGCIWWMLAREVLRLRGTIPRTKDGWDVMVDMFFHRDAEEVEKQQQEEAASKVQQQSESAPQEWDVSAQPGLGAISTGIVNASALDWSAEPAQTSTDWAAEPAVASGWGVEAAAQSSGWD